MKLNRIELKKILYDFNSISNRLLQAPFEEYNSILAKFLNYIKSTELIYDYVVDCGECDQNLDEEFKEISAAYGNAIFSLGETDEEEVRNIFAILNYIVDKNIDIHFRIAIGYSHDNKYQSKIKGFNDRVVLVLIRHIERFLTKIGIDMGIDEKTTYLITVTNGQVNIANDGSSIEANNYVGIDEVKLVELINAVRKTSKDMPEEDKEIVDTNLDVIQEEVKSQKPRRKFLRTALTGLKGLKFTAEFGAAVATLATFIQSLLI